MTCDFCEREYLDYVSRASKAKRHYCDAVCMKAARRGDVNPNWRGGSDVRKCQICGAEFSTVPASTKRCCSRRCGNLARTKPRLEVTCAACGNAIVCVPSTRVRRFCSNRCVAEGNRIHASQKELDRAKNHRRDVRIRAARKLSGYHTEQEWTDLLKKHRGRCARCGTSKNISRDHIIPLSKGGTDLIGNIQPLCIPCNVRKGAKC